MSILSFELARTQRLHLLHKHQPWDSNCDLPTYLLPTYLYLPTFRPTDRPTYLPIPTCPSTYLPYAPPPPTTTTTTNTTTTTTMTTMTTTTTTTTTITARQRWQHAVVLHGSPCLPSRSWQCLELPTLDEGRSSSVPGRFRKIV